MKFHNLSVRAKLWTLVMGLMFSLVVLGAALMARTEGVVRQSEQLVGFGNERIFSALRWKALTQSSVESLLVAMQTSDQELSARQLAQAQKMSAAVGELQKEVEAQAFWPDNRAQLERIAAERAEVLKVAAVLQKQRADGDMAALQQTAQQTFAPAMDKYVAALDTYIRMQQERRDEALADAAASRRASYALGAAVTVFLLLVGLALAWLMVRSITAPLQRAVELADTIAGGDLTHQAHDERRDELGQLLRSLSAMGASLRQLVGQVRSGVQTVSAAAGEISMGNHDLSARTEQTAANLEETAASMEQLTATVTQSADTARQANQLVGSALQAAQQGETVVGQVIASMEGISRSSHRIGDIIGVIDSIAFQTNILALNAAVEAARAGEQGRGFAVVASEVRVLAGRSAEAAREIKALISSSVEGVQAGSSQVQQAGQSMQAIMHSVRQVSDLMGEISAGSAEQRDGIGQVNQAVSNLDQMTQQNAALVEQASAAAAAMNEQAQRLAQAVAVFNVGADESGRRAALPGAATGSAPVLQLRAGS